VTVIVSLTTVPKASADLEGLVYGLTDRATVAHPPWHQRPAVLGTAVLVLTAALNVIFW